MQPPPYAPATSFLVYQAQQAWFPGQQLDVEFNAIAASTTAIEHNLAEIQSDDGTLADSIVAWETLDPALQLRLESAGFVPTNLFTTSNTWGPYQTFSGGLRLGASQYINWGNTTGVAGYGIRDLGGTLQFKNSSGNWATFSGKISVTDFGADNTGIADSASAIAGAIAAASAINSGLACVYFPAGIYLIGSTIQISSSNVFLVGEQGASCVLIERKTDFGVAIQFSNASNVIANVGLHNIEIADVSAINNVPGYSTVATSPYQVIFDGCNTVYMSNVQLQSGSGGLALKGVLSAYCSNIVLVNPGTSELDSTGTGLYIGFSANTNLAVRYCSGVHFTVLEMEGGSPFAGKLNDGVRVDGCDGLWFNDAHIQGTRNADLHLAHSGAFPMANLFFANTMLDECAGNGLLMDGTRQIQQCIFNGNVSCGAGGGTNKAGITSSSTGGLKNFTFAGTIVGWGGSGIVLNSSNTLNVTIRAEVFGNNLSAGSNPAISIQNCLNCSIVGGVAGGGDACNPNIALGASAARVSIAGVLAASSTTFGVTIAAGATFVVITGCDLSGNLSGAISDSSGAITKKFVGNLGATDLFSDGNPVIVGLAGSAAMPALAIGNSTTGLFSVSTTGFGISVNGVSKADFGITTSSVWTFPVQTNFTAGIAASSNTTGSIVVTGGIGASGLIWGQQVVSNGQLFAANGVAATAGGAAAIAMGTAAAFGLYWGSGLPTVAASKGSLYLRTDGSSGSTRLYVNTDGASTWTNFTSAA